MRFRAPNLGRQDAAGGIGNFFMSLAQAPMLEAQAAQQAQDAQAKRDLMGTQQQLYQSQIGGNLAEAALKQRQLQTMEERPDNLRLMAASRAGVSVPDLSAAISERQNGAPAMGPSYLSGPIPGLGASGRTANFDDVIANLYAPAMTTSADKEINFESLAKMRGEYQDQGAMSEALDMARGGNYMGSNALTAVRSGRDFSPYKAVGSTGTTLNEVTGAQQTADAGLRALYGNDVQAGIRQKGASAAASYASADSSRASAARTRAEMERGGKGVLQQTDQGLVLVDPITAQATPVMVNGQPAGRPGGGATKMTEDQGKATGWLIQANNAWKNMQAAALGPPDATGSRPVLGAAKPGFNDALAAIPSFGAGEAIGNSMRTAERQKFLQASSSLSEALLRAATGAGVNIEEARQKVREITPQFGDDEANIRQKFDAIPLYLESLKVRAGGGARLASDAGLLDSGAPPTLPAGRGASGSWGDAPAAGGGWSIQRVE